MIRQRWTPPLLFAASAIVLSATPVAGSLLGPLARALLVAFALLWIPGELCCRALGVSDEVGSLDRGALCFGASLGLWTVVSALLVAFALPLSSALGLLMALIAALALTANLRSPQPSTRDDHLDDREHQRGLVLVALAAGALVTAAAWYFTASGSVDRWWYLAYVRSLLQAPAVDFSDPLLGTGKAIGRFAFHPWLLMLAMWSRCARVDPVWLYQSAAPLVLVPLAFSSALLFGRTLFGCARMAWLTALASCLLWASASLFPLVARAPEDKILALLLLAPTLLAVLIRSITSAKLGWAIMLGVIIVPLVTTHALVYALVMLSALPFVLLSFTGSGDARTADPPLRATMIALLLLVVGAAAALALGSLAKQGLEASGVLLGDPGHPVIRIHQARQRLLELQSGGYIVNPRLLMHPLIIIALGSLVFIPGRTAIERRMLVPATIVALALAFIPPLAGLAGLVAFPWMVYRILWAIPLAALLAVFIDESSRRFSLRPLSLCLVLAIVVAPWIRGSLLQRSTDSRQRLALPDSPELVAALDAIAALPDNALVATAGELAERLPALTGVHVLAASDRATIVFSASRPRGEARLRANTAIAAAMWKPTEGVPSPSHVLFAPGAAAEYYCDERIYANSQFVLCSFRASAPQPGVKLREQSLGIDSNNLVLLDQMLDSDSDPWTIKCAVQPELSPNREFLVWHRPGPWSARNTLVDCSITHKPQARQTRQALWLHPLALRLKPVLGAAVDEFTIAVRGQRDGIQRWNLRTRRRVADDESLSFSLPHGAVDSIHLRVLPTFLPFIKLTELSIVLEPSLPPESQ